MDACIVISCLTLVLLFWGIGAVKRLKRLRHRALRAFSQAEGLMKRRHDLIPELARKIDVHLGREHEALDAVIAARNRAAAAQRRTGGNPAQSEPITQLAAEEDALSAALDLLFEAGDASAQWKDDPQWQKLHIEMDDIGKRISFARQEYADRAHAYDAAIEQWPRHLIARLFGFGPLTLL